MFIKLKNSYGSVYVRIDQIKSIRVDREGDTIIHCIGTDSNVIWVNETPDEIMKEIERITKKKEIKND